jgi:hypothetical protein
VIGLIVGIIAGAIGVALDTHRKRRLGIKDEPIVPKAKKYKADWVSDENYKRFLRTGDRNYLWEKDYKRWDDHEMPDYSDDLDAEDKECESVMREVKEFLDKDKPKLVLPDSYIMEQQQRRAHQQNDRA